QYKTEHVPLNLCYIRNSFTQNIKDKSLRQSAITVINKTSALASITSVLSKQNATITNLKIIHRTDLFIEFAIDLEVFDLDHLDNVIAHLRANSIVNNVERANMKKSISKNKPEKNNFKMESEPVIKF
ncbi:MAG: ACT domain-containing protein, partial [Janthinobacterium lividum]